MFGGSEPGEYYTRKQLYVDSINGKIKGFYAIGGAFFGCDGGDKRHAKLALLIARNKINYLSSINLG